jgi:adenylate cyclase
MGCTVCKQKLQDIKLKSMKKLPVKYGKWILINAIVWSLGKQLFIAIKFWGLEKTVLENIAVEPVSLLFVVGLTGLLDGTVFAFFDIAFNKYFGGISFVKQVLSKTVIYLFLGLSMTVLFVPCLLGWTKLESMMIFSRVLGSGNLVVAAFYFLLITTLLQFGRLVTGWIQANDVLQIISYSGRGVQEDRIFLFLDMRSSTKHAELLGPSLYSDLILDCFRDMGDAATQNKAELYQYVGDEVVFTWKTSTENINRAIDLYFQFNKTLKLRASEYRRKYNLIPHFKGGIHHGRVVRVLVSVNRNATAYHGDVVNTTARIQSKCNDLGCNLLASPAIIENVSDRYTIWSKGCFQLRGKDNEVSLFSIEENAAAPITAVTQLIDCRRSKVNAFTAWLNVFV